MGVAVVIGGMDLVLFQVWSHVGVSVVTGAMDLLLFQGWSNVHVCVRACVCSVGRCVLMRVCVCASQRGLVVRPSSIMPVWSCRECPLSHERTWKSFKNAWVRSYESEELHHSVCIIAAQPLA